MASKRRNMFYKNKKQETTEIAAVDVCTLLLALLGLFSNLLVVILFYRRPALRSPSNRFVGSLVFANLVSAVVLAPVLLCRQPVLSAGVSVLVATSSVFSIVSIALDRYSAVLSPLHYTMTVTRKRSAAVIGGTWCLSGALAAPHLVLPCRGGSAEWQGGGGLIGASVSPVFWLTHSLVLLLLGFTLPLIALVLIYSRMYAAAHSNSVRTRRASQCGGGGGGGGCGGLDCEGSRRSSNSVFSALLFREEGRAVKTGFMVVGSYLFCWAPYFVSTASEAWGGVPLPRHLVVLCVLSSSSLNPFIYVFRNDLVRKETRRLMCWWREGANQSLGGGRGSAAGKDGKGAGRHAGGGGGRGGGGEQPTLRQQSSSQCDSVSVQSLQVSTMGPLPSTPLPNDCCKHLDTPPPADFVATYHQVSGDATRYESVTFRLAQRRCQSCIRQNSDSSTGSGHPLLTPTRRQPSSEPSTPRHITNNNTDEKNIVFKFQLGGDDLEAAGPRRHKLERHSAIDDTATDV